MSIANTASRLALHPLYGSIPTSLHFHTVLLAAILLSPFLPSPAQSNCLAIIASLLAFAPVSAFWVGSRSARHLGPVWGPVLTHLVLAAPITSLGSSLVCKWIVSVMPSDHPAAPANKRHTQTCIPQSAISRLAFSLLLPLFLGQFSLDQHPYRHNTYPYSTVTTNGTVTILARTQSTTGTIIIAEHSNASFRYMRCDHSLLGGRWIVKAPSGAELGENIWEGFALHDAVRLVERATPLVSGPERALVIGLGVGISTSAFMEHSIQTTVVEIDPAVYQYARQFFGLPEPHAVFLEDARGWVHKSIDSLPESERFDYVVHDCFSGGAVPMHMFTTEFWSDLKQIVKPDGVVAVNFVGVLESDATRAILATLLRNFRQCRVFHDKDVGDDKRRAPTDFLDLVFYCTSSKRPLEFRLPKPSDYLASAMREAVLTSLPEREVDFSMIWGNRTPESDKKWILTDNYNPLNQWQRPSALRHWRILRSLLPDEAWEFY
ncbi:hypothetical protein BOTBODRAFT_126200 [Botryobasidium botryosum FD-172 SS1]|uniref:PABS domain-containing protein n=1 Tax=Botryobasidium botryosum (strain FD-172 SS1) TaxID=930990 RepID=A0A067MUV2_BOTB1|nr:hypothetical protein BOTBODRAFT_126200 [Botryobasidium botryosum FD-172 SS1]